MLCTVNSVRTIAAARLQRIRRSAQYVTCTSGDLALHQSVASPARITRKRRKAYHSKLMVAAARGTKASRNREELRELVPAFTASLRVVALIEASEAQPGEADVVTRSSREICTTRIPSVRKRGHNSSNGPVELLSHTLFWWTGLRRRSMPVKRNLDRMEDVGSTSSPYIPMFEQFRSELDEHYDRRERIIKASRDITAASKKVIFSLQRIKHLQQPLPGHVVNANKPHFAAISSQFSSVSRDLQSLNAYRYARQISGGCQEFVEAASFQHYLTETKLLPYEEADNLVKGLDEGGPGVELSIDDYLLGIYDMTGELMKFAITTMATSGALPSTVSVDENEGQGALASPSAQRNVLNDMRVLRSALETIDISTGPLAKEVEKKHEVMQASVEKVEKALYGMTVRGAERPKGWIPDLSDNAQVVEVGG